MVEDQIIKRGIEDKRVLDIMKSVERHKFVPEEYAKSAYKDGPLPIGHGQTISQPFIVAFMTENLKLGPSHRVLEIGTGSGYQTAILSALSGHVYTMEIIDELAKLSSSVLKKLGFDNVTVRNGNGYKGWAEEAPFDRIMVTAAPEEIPNMLVDQLTEGGIMVIPVGEQFEIQYLWVLTKEHRGSIKKEKILPVRFVPMVTKH
jgi:protein-L-isoaspartate(D-aspartate) O-methyltransferase